MKAICALRAISNNIMQSQLGGMCLFQSSHDMLDKLFAILAQWDGEGRWVVPIAKRIGGTQTIHIG